MAEYISKDELKAAILKRLGISGEQYLVHSEKVLVDVINKMSPADVVERKTGKNVATEYEDCDQFVCSECGIELQDWHRVERDEDDGDVTYHEYWFRFCPNCGMKIKGGDDDV